MDEVNLSDQMIFKEQGVGLAPDDGGNAGGEAMQWALKSSVRVWLSR
jgi:hypothetical protein